MATVAIPDWTASERLFHQLLREPSDSAMSIGDHNGQIDWQEISDLARHHRVEALVAANISASLPSGFPAEFSVELSRKTKRQIQVSLGTVHATVQAAVAFRTAGINCILLKSDAVSQRYYGSPYGRFSKDIDFLISPNDFPAAAKVLRDLGYHQDGPGFEIPPDCLGMVEMLRPDVSFKNKKNGQNIELHWRQFRNPNLFPIRFSEAYAGGTTVRLGREDIAVFDAPNQLVYLMCHGAIHSWFRLKWLADIDRMFAQMTPAEIDAAWAIATKHGLDRIMNLGFSVCKIVFGDCGAASAHDREMTKSEWQKIERILSIIHQRPEAGHGQKARTLFELGDVIGDHFALLNLHSSMRYKSSELLPMLVTEADVDRFRLSRNWLGVYIIVGPVHRLVRSMKTSLRKSTA